VKQWTLKLLFPVVLAILQPSVLLVAEEKLDVDGGWTSGGGELLKDAHNPWFVRTFSLISAVSYCIDHDAEHFSLPLVRSRALIQSAIEQWRRDFQYAGIPSQNSPRFYVADEMWIERPCPTGDQADDIMVRFQLGTLTDKQQQSLQSQHIDPTSYVSLAIRENYDRRTLRGKGFVYIGPSSGPLKPRIGRDDIDPWSIDDGRLFFAAVMHELGHVFGIPHHGTSFQLMGAGFPEFLVTQATQTFANYTLSVFRQPFDAMLYGYRCFPVSDKARRFFNFSADIEYATFVMTMEREIHAYQADHDQGCFGASDELDRKRTLVAKIVLDDSPTIDSSPLVSLWVVPELQQVISGISPTQSTRPMILPGPMIERRTYGATLHDLRDGSAPKPAILYLSPEIVRIGGIIDNTIDVEILKLTF